MMSLRFRVLWLIWGLMWSPMVTMARVQSLQLRNFRKLDEAKDLPPEILKKTKSVGAGLYWFALLSNTALIGFGLPKVLNKFLRHNIDKEKENLSVKNANAKAFTGISMNDFVKQ